MPRLFYPGKKHYKLIFYRSLGLQWIVLRILVPDSCFMINIVARIQQIKDTIHSACTRADRDPEKVKLVVVTKSVTLEAVKEVINLGVTDFGENRVQQLKKISTEVADYLKGSEGNPATPKKINWHMIGHLQRNKVRQVLPIAVLIHSVDTLRLAEEINTAAAKMNSHPKVLLQVNCSNEPQKYGVPVGAATHLAEQIVTLPNLELVGLMTMAPLTHNKDVVRSCFVRARELFVEMCGERIVGPQFTELSMGMSSDFEIAVEEGATILRIGSAIFAG